jgi:hypothetical protein
MANPVTRAVRERQRFLKILLSNCTMNNGNLYLRMASPFDILAKANESWDWLGDRESNPD